MKHLNIKHKGFFIFENYEEGIDFDIPEKHSISKFIPFDNFLIESRMFAICTKIIEFNYIDVPKEQWKILKHKYGIKTGIFFVDTDTLPDDIESVIFNIYKFRFMFGRIWILRDKTREPGNQLFKITETSKLMVDEDD